MNEVSAHLSRTHFLFRTIRQQGLCISRATAPIINIVVILIMLPVCKTFNKLVHKALGKVSVHLLAFYLEKLKVIHQSLAVTLVFTSGEHGCDSIAGPELIPVL